MCAALFVAAMVLPAMAVDMSISGFYRVRGIYQSNADAGSITPWEKGNAPVASESPNAWWDHMLQLDPVFKVTDNVKLVTRVSMFNNQIWGSGQTSGGVPTTGNLTLNGYGANADNILVNGAYLDWNTEVGRVKIGRMPGYNTYFTPWANSTLDADRLMYFSPTWDGLSFYAYTEKQIEGDATNVQASDQDLDRYAVLVQYAAPSFYLGAALDYYRDRSNSAGGAANPAAFAADWYATTLCAKFNTPGNTIFAEAEVQFQFGDAADFYSATQDLDRGGWGGYLNVGTKVGPATVGAAVAYTSGDNNAADGDYDVGPASGLDFQPMYIVYGPLSNGLNTTAGTGEKAGFSNTAGNQFGAPDATATGSLAYLVYADFAPMPQLALHGAIGYAEADEINTALYQDEELGWEFDLGMKYQIMNNLAYELHLGYLWVGDFFKGTAANNYSEDDVYQIDHNLTLSF